MSHLHTFQRPKQVAKSKASAEGYTFESENKTFAKNGTIDHGEGVITRNWRERTMRRQLPDRSCDFATREQSAREQRGGRWGNKCLPPCCLWPALPVSVPNWKPKAGTLILYLCWSVSWEGQRDGKH